MILSRILMVLLLAVLAYMVYVIVSCGDKTEKTSAPTTTAAPAGTSLAGALLGNETTTTGAPVTTTGAPVTTTGAPVTTTGAPVTTTGAPVTAEGFGNIRYEHFENASGVTETVHGAAPFKNNTAVPDTQYATVKFSGLVDANPEDVLQIEGTDLLTAPLVDNMLYTNSIANTNRNASQDLRGDLPLQFNETYTPFYSSVIYGAPLSQHSMTIGNVGTNA
jgi:hypothetical protein